MWSFFEKGYLIKVKFTAIPSGSFNGGLMKPCGKNHWGIYLENGLAMQMRGAPSCWKIRFESPGVVEWGTVAFWRNLPFSLRLFIPAHMTSTSIRNNKTLTLAVNIAKHVHILITKCYYKSFEVVYVIYEHLYLLNIRFFQKQRYN